MTSTFRAKLSLRLATVRRWLLDRLEQLASSRAAQAALRVVSRRHRYTGRHRQDLDHQYQYSIDAATKEITVRAPHAKRTPASILRAHLPRQRSKEDALVGQVFTGRVSRFQVDLIATIAIAMQQVKLWDEERRNAPIEWARLPC